MKSRRSAVLRRDFCVNIVADSRMWISTGCGFHMIVDCRAKGRNHPVRCESGRADLYRTVRKSVGDCQFFFHLVPFFVS